jgi:hypothetical protein
MHETNYEGPLKSLWAHLITPSRNFVEVRWRSLFRSTSLDKRCTSYNAPPTSRKRAADRWSLRNFLPWSSLFMVGKAHKSHGARSGLYGGCSNGVPPIHSFQAEHRIQYRSQHMRFLGFSNREKGAQRQEISKWSTVCRTFSRSKWNRLREVLWKRDRHRTSTKFRLGVIRRVHELFKRPPYYSLESDILQWNWVTRWCRRPSTSARLRWYTQNSATSWFGMQISSLKVKV